MGERSQVTNLASDSIGAFRATAQDKRRRAPRGIPAAALPACLRLPLPIPLANPTWHFRAQSLLLYGPKARRSLCLFNSKHKNFTLRQSQGEYARYSVNAGLLTASRPVSQMSGRVLCSLLFHSRFGFTTEMALVNSKDLGGPSI